MLHLDVDECAVENGGCEQGCANTQGSFTCSCKKGYLINADAKSCKGKQASLRNYLRNHHQIVVNTYFKTFNLHVIKLQEGMF